MRGRGWPVGHGLLTLQQTSRGWTPPCVTLATGTGKTFIAFQIAWKLFKARWNLQAAEGDGRPGARTPRILFITDRNILANQGLIDFSGFDEHALARVTPKAIHKRDDKVPTNATVFFTIYETLMQGEPGRADLL